MSTLGEIMRERKEMGLFKGEFLDEIMQKENLSDEERRNVALDILLAGYETTSGLLGLVIYFTAKAPSVLQKLKVY